MHDCHTQRAQLSVLPLGQAGRFFGYLFRDNDPEAGSVKGSRLTAQEWKNRNWAFQCSPFTAFIHCWKGQSDSQLSAEGGKSLLRMLGDSLFCPSTNCFRGGRSVLEINKKITLS